MPTDRESKYTKTVNNSGRLLVNEEYDFVVRFPEMAVLCVQLMDEDAGAAAAWTAGELSGRGRACAYPCIFQERASYVRRLCRRACTQAFNLKSRSRS